MSRKLFTISWPRTQEGTNTKSPLFNSLNAMVQEIEKDQENTSRLEKNFLSDLKNCRTLEMAEKKCQDPVSVKSVRPEILNLIKQKIESLTLESYKQIIKDELGSVTKELNTLLKTTRKNSKTGTPGDRTNYEQRENLEAYKEILESLSKAESMPDFKSKYESARINVQTSGHSVEKMDTIMNQLSNLNSKLFNPGDKKTSLKPR